MPDVDVDMCVGLVEFLGCAALCSQLVHQEAIGMTPQSSEPQQQKRLTSIKVFELQATRLMGGTVTMLDEVVNCLGMPGSWRGLRVLFTPDVDGSADTSLCESTAVRAQHPTN